jgi:hypothetical protein
MSVLLLHRRDDGAIVAPTRWEGAKKPDRQAPMELIRDIEKFARSRSLIECAQCGDRIYIPEWSECLDRGRIRHLWQCEACGYTSETTVRFEAVEA